MRQQSNAELLVALDFDGTLAAIVDDPRATRPVVGVLEAIAQLGDAGAHVAIISGRPLDFLVQHFGSLMEHDWFTLVGEYGIERVHAGVRSSEPFPQHMADALAAARDEATTQGPVGMSVEAKPHSMTLHYRTAPEAQTAVQFFADELAKRHGLETRPAKMSIELHPIVSNSKGTALTALLQDLTGQTNHQFPVVFIGDDVGDLPAFRVLSELRARQWEVVSVVVQSAESSPELLAHADLLLDGPDAVVQYLHSVVASDLQVVNGL